MQDLLRILQHCRPVWPGRSVPPKRIANAGERFCTGCERVKPEDDFYLTARARKDGVRPRRSRCKECEKAAIAERRRG
jgi:hypothetical protein